MPPSQTRRSLGLPDEPKAEDRSGGGAPDDHVENALVARRGFLLLCAGVAAASTLPLSSLSGCRRAQPAAPTGSASDGAGRDNGVVLYSSVDADVLEPLMRHMTTATGISVQTVGDTEATKSTGLATRLLSEADSPQADMFWSSEPLGLVDLASRGVLVPGLAKPTAQWPANLYGRGGHWIGFSLRLRQVVYSTAESIGRMNGRAAPTTLEDLADPIWKGRVGIARPQFGTTRGQMAWLLMLWGSARFEMWLQKLNDNGVRLFDGNSGVVRAVGSGLIDIGLTDSDDVLGGIAQGWGVRGVSAAASTDKQDANGCLAVPNAVGLIAGRPPNPAREILLAWLLSGLAEEAMAASPSANIPVRDVLAGASTSAITLPAGVVFPDWHEVHGHVQSALALCEKHLGR